MRSTNAPPSSTRPFGGGDSAQDRQDRVHSILDVTDVDGIAAAVAHELRTAVAATVAYVALEPDAFRGSELARDARAPRPQTLRIASVDGDSSLLGPWPLEVVASGHALAGDATGDGTTPRWIAPTPIHGEAPSDARSQSTIVVPLGPFGVAVAVTTVEHGAEAMRAVRNIGAAARAALRHALALEQVRNLKNRLHALLSIQRTLAIGVLDEVFEKFAARLSEEVPFDSAYVGVLVPGSAARPQSRDQLEIVAEWGSDGENEACRAGTRIPLAGTSLPEVLRSSRVRAEGETFIADVRDPMLTTPGGSGVVVPLVVADAVLGVLVLVSRSSRVSTGGPLGDTRWLLGAIAEPLAIALQNATLFTRLRTTMRDWEATFDVMDALVFLADAAGNVRRANWAIARRLGKTPSALVGRPATSLFGGQELPLARDGVRTATVRGPAGESLRVSASPLAGGGTVVVLQNELAPAAGAPVSTPAIRRVATGSQPTIPMRGRVLIVDDEPSILRAVTRTLSRQHEIVSASDGDEALAIIRADLGDFLAVITDLQMPRLGGIELYRTVEREFPNLAERFLFMTGGVFGAESELFLHQFEHRVLRKPFDPDVLRRALDERIARGARVA